MQNENKEWLTIKDISARLGVSGESVRLLIVTNKLRALNVSARGTKKPQWRVHVKWFEEYSESAPPAGNIDKYNEREACSLN